jgi:hypothetical protein
MIEENFENIPTAYYNMTQSNAAVAVAVKKATFITPKDAFWGAEDKWQKQLKGCLSWWKTKKKKNENKNEDDDIEPENFSEIALEALQKCTGGTYSSGMKMSQQATQIGTFIHEEYGRILAQQALLTKWQDKDVVTPGRIISPTFSLCASTPDALTVRKEEAFLKYYRHIYSLDPLKVSFDDELYTLSRMAHSGAPLFVHEFKTINKTSITRLELEALLRAADEDDKKNVNHESNAGDKNERFRVAFEKVLTRAFKDGDWSSGKAPNFSRGKRTRGDNDGDEKLLFTNKNLSFAPRGKNRLIRHRKGDGSYKNCIYEGQLFRHLASVGTRVPLGEYFVPSSWATYTVYNPEDPGKVLKHVDVENSPYLLSPVCEHMSQMLSQGIAVMAMNDKAVYVLSVILSYAFKGERSRPAIQFSMPVCINKKIIEKHLWRIYQAVADNDDTWREFDFTRNDLSATISSKLERFIAQPGLKFPDPPTFPNISSSDLFL